MTGESRFDSRLGIALQESVVAPQPTESAAALARVLQRSARGRRRRRILVPAILAATAVVAMAGIFWTTVALNDDRGLPSSRTDGESSIVGGVWRRELTEAGAKDWRGTWTLFLKPDGSMVVSTPPQLRGVGTDGNSWRIEGSTLQVDAFVGGACPDLPPATYAWHYDGEQLQLTAVKETCAARSDVFDGFWAPVGGPR